MMFVLGTTRLAMVAFALLIGMYTTYPALPFPAPLLNPQTLYIQVVCFTLTLQLYELLTCVRVRVRASAYTCVRTRVCP
jgi:hypothetical protein